MPSSTDLRRHAEHCRYLADITANPQDKQVLRQSAADFDAEAERADGNPRAAAELTKAKS